MAIEPTRPVGSGTTPVPSPQKKTEDPSQKPQQPAPASQPLPNKDQSVIRKSPRGDDKYVPLPPGQEPTVIQQAESGAYEFIAHIFNKIKMAIVFPTLAPDREISGYVVSSDKIGAPDGDFNLEVVPLEKDRDVLEYRGRTRAMVPEKPSPAKFVSPQGAAAAQRGVIVSEISEDAVGEHPELRPMIERIRKLMAQGKTPLVRLHGQWTFDPFHDGWVEIHPVKGLEIVDENAVPPPTTPPSPTSGLWADTKPKFRISGIPEDYTVRSGGTVGNGGGFSLGVSKDLLTFGTLPGYTANGNGEISSFKSGVRGTLAADVTGIMARNDNSQLRVGGALGVEVGSWGHSWRVEAVGGEAFAGDAAHQGPYVGGRIGYSVNIGPAGSRMGLFAQVDKTLADQGPITGTIGLSFSF